MTDLQSGYHRRPNLNDGMTPEECRLLDAGFYGASEELGLTATDLNTGLVALAKASGMGVKDYLQMQLDLQNRGPLGD